MSRKVAILGLGETGGRWARDFHTAGWQVTGFDPDPAAEGAVPLKGDWKRCQTISETVRGADWVMICLPERLELMQKVIQRAQAEAPKGTILASTSRSVDVDAVQGCAVRPGQVIQVRRNDDDGFDVFVTSRNDTGLKDQATLALSAIAAVTCLGDDAPTSAAQPRGKASA